MRFGQLAVLLLTLGSSTGNSAAPHRVAPAVPTQGKTPPDEPPAGKRAITLPTGTKVAVALTGPLWSKTAHAGDGVYAVSVFPVAVAQHMAIPPGTYIEGRIDLIKRPTWIVPRAEFRMHFTKLIFANGYTVDLTAPQRPAHLMAANAPAPNQAASATATAVIQDSQAAVAEMQVAVSPRSDILLDNGSQIEVTLQTALSLDAERVADAARRSRPIQLAAFRTASRCVPIPPTPGTSPTVIPGTPATPPTVIPQGPGQPDIVIPGSSGTDPIVIGGSSGSPGVPCPAPPVVISVSRAPAKSSSIAAATNTKPELTPQTWPGDHAKTLRLTEPVRLGSRTLPAGAYRLTWIASGPSVQVDISRGDRFVMRASAHTAVVAQIPDHDQSIEYRNSEGPMSLKSLEFAGEEYTLIFD